MYDLIGPEEYTESRLSLHQLLQIAYPDYYPLKKSNLNLKMQNLLKGKNLTFVDLRKSFLTAFCLTFVDFF